MGAIRALAAPIQSTLRFPLVQLAIVVAVVLLLQSADEGSAAGRLFAALDRLVEYSVQKVSAAFHVKSFTRSWLTTSLWIGYVYLAGLFLLWLLRLAIALGVELAARWNLLWLRHAIAHERGIAAYRAWEPLERIRPEHIRQDEWEETYAWPADGSPPYPRWPIRLARWLAGWLIVILGIAGLLQYFTPVHALTWLGRLIGVGG